MAKVVLRELYRDPRKVVITAHRGFSGRYPENTLLAFGKAVELGVDMIEFDLRGSKDGVPIVLHDVTLDRTTTGTGRPEDYTLSALKQLNASCWMGAHNEGYRTASGAYPGVTIPTFEEVLKAVPETVGLNIQVYAADEAVLGEICRLYEAYDLYDRGYLAMSGLASSRAIRTEHPRIELCALERQGSMDRAMLEEMREMGLWLIQPLCQDVTPAFCAMAKEMGFCANMFFANTDEDNEKYIQKGMQGILTDYPDRLKKTAARLGLK